MSELKFSEWNEKGQTTSHLRGRIDISKRKALELLNDKEKRKFISKNAINKIKNNFLVSNATDKYIDLFNKVLK